MTLVDDKTALVEKPDFDALPEYSCSIPTGTTIGKRWKRAVFEGGRYGAGKVVGWLLGEYAECEPPEDGLVAIIWRQMEIV